MGLDIHESQIDAVTLVAVSGRLTLGVETEQLRERVREVFRNGHQWILIDLGELHVIDSAGVGELVSIHSSIARQGGVVKFLRPSRKLKEMFHVTRLENLFESFDDEVQAVSSFSTQPASQNGAAVADLVD